MGEVRAAQSFDLGIEIRKIAPLQQRVVREIYARRHILRAEGDLLGLREEIVDHPVEHQSANHRSEEHTSELQSLMRISYAVFCLTKKKNELHDRTNNKYNTTQI